MKNILFTLVLVQMLVSCINEKEPIIKDQLEGKWRMGLMDTVSRTYDFADVDSPEREEFIINTDTGTYKHSYVDDTLIDIIRHEDVNILEFKFDSDSTGLIYKYVGKPATNRSEYDDLPDTFKILNYTDRILTINVIPGHLLAPLNMQIELAKDCIHLSAYDETWTYIKLKEL